MSSSFHNIRVLELARILAGPRCGQAGTIPGVRSPILIGDVPQAGSRPPPGLGQHAAGILFGRAWGGGDA